MDPRPHDSRASWPAQGGSELPRKAAPPDSADGWADTWLTFGEAADLADVTHRALDDWARSDALVVRRGWREGVEIRLVRAGDLAELVPTVRERVHRDSPAASASADAAPRRGTLDERGVFTGPRVSALGRSEGVSASDGQVVIPVRLPLRASDEDRAWATELEREIARLRGDIEWLRGDRDRLSVLAGESPGQASSEHAGSTGPSNPAEPDARSPRPRFVTELGRSSSFVVPLFTAICALIVGVSIGTQLIPESEPMALAGAAGSPREVAAFGPTVRPDEGPAEGLAGGPLASVVADDAPFGLPIEASTPIAEVTAEVTGDVTDDLTDDLTGEVAGKEAAIPALGPTTSPAPEASRSEARALAPQYLADVDAALFRSPPAGTTHCAYGDRVAADRDVLLALGPCFGAHAPGESPSAVAGSHRVRGVACCRHHAFVERMTSASRDTKAVEGLLAEARLARADGYLPALLRLRAERSATRFLRSRAGVWEAAGIDGAPTDGDGDPVAPAHAWRELDVADDGSPRIELSSWVTVLPAFARERPVQGAATGGGLRAFRMRLRLEAGTQGDVLESFEWLDD